MKSLHNRSQKHTQDDPKAVLTSRAAEKGGNVSNASSDKRKRPTFDDGNGSRHDQSSKKHQTARPDILQSIKSRHTTSTDQDSSAATIKTIPTMPVVKSHRQSATEARQQRQLTPPSSNATSESDSRNEESAVSCQTLKRDIKIPTSARKIAEGPVRPRSSSASPKPNKKRQRCETDVAEKILKRQHVSRTVERIKAQQAPPVQHPQAWAVRPDSSFAPVTPNPECELQFLDYDHQSVPVLYSTMIKHRQSNELLNCPPDDLVFDALDAVETGFKPLSKYGWPSVDHARRPAGKNRPVRVLNDIDLYLHSKNGKLYVATEQGLLIVSGYLKLIGVPEGQPIRFDGRIPPWANAALRAREKRRVVKVWGKVKKTQDKQLEEHHAVTKLQRHVTARDRGTNEEYIRDASHAIKAAENFEEQEDENEEILKANLGDLPLPLGSTVIVYKIDEDERRAYGRLCNTDKKGWFPVSHTCPIDWSVDKFTESNPGSFNKPLPESADPEEKDWQGLTHWIRQKGYPEGPSWKEICAATAAEAKVKAKAAAVRRKLVARMTELNAALGSVATATPLAASNAVDAPRVDQSTKITKPPLEAATKKDMPATTVGETAATELTITTTGSAPTEVKIGGVTAKLSLSTIRPEDAKNFQIATVELVTFARTVDDISGAQIPAAIPLTVEVEGTSSEVDSGTEVTPDGETQEAVGEPDGREEAELSQPHEVHEVVIEEAAAPGSRDPFKVPRYDPFARNDDIEYDWGDSDDEEL